VAKSPERGKLCAGNNTPCMSRTLLLTAVALVCAGSNVFGDQAGTTALGALKVLPKAVVGKVALIEAREGRPSPDRWHILVHDPKEENGLHEYVVANGEIVASRSLSQFAESLTPEDVIKDAVKVDSDRAAKLAQLYAEANNIPVAEMNFELKRDGDAAPIWSVTCLDARGVEFGRIVVTATKGTIVSHDGFAIDPPSLDKTRSQTDGSVVHAEPIGDKRPKRPDVVRRAEPVVKNPDEDRPGFFQRAGGTIQHIFTGH